MALAASVFKNDQGQWVAEYLFESEPDEAFLHAVMDPIFAAQGIAMPAAHSEPVEADQDWLALCYRALPAFSVGKFYVYGSHCEGPVPDGQTGLLIDAVQAFGSGSHGTTYGCLQLLQDLADDATFVPRTILDMGTGSGILAVGAAYLWPDIPVVASDIEEESAQATLRHATANNVEDRVINLHADGFAHDVIASHAPYDLVIANILPSVLKVMANDIASHATVDAYVLLSGIRDEQAPGVIDHYAALDIKEKSRISRDGWTSLLLRRTA